MPWVQLSVEVDAAHAEPLADALLEAGAQSVCLAGPDAARPRIEALLAEAADPAGCLAHAAAACGIARPGAFAVERVADDDWVRRSQSAFPPVRIGGRLWIGATWHAPDPGRIAVTLDPGIAFGTGTHPTTRLMLEFLERRVQGGESVLDYGCGSGILAIAAAKLGARRVDAVDIDPDAVATTLANARANDVSIGTHLPDALPPGTYDVVISNILAQPLVVLAPLLAERVRPGGLLALAGLLAVQSGEVAAAYAGAFDLASAAVEDGWALLAGKRR